MNLTEIKTNPNNPRVIKDARFKQLKKSIEDLPHMMVLRPIVIDETGTVLGGNMRLEALKSLGYKDVPDDWVKRTDELSEEQKKEFVIKDNAGFGEWDWDQLANEWSEYPLADWGVDIPEEWAASPKVEEDESAVAEMIDKAAELQKKWKVERGQIWEIGKHRLMCGDSTSKEDVDALMRGQIADITLTSPPYNVGKTPNGDDQKYLNDSDKKDSHKYTEFLCTFTRNALDRSRYVFVNIQSVAGNKLSLIEYLYSMSDVFADYVIWDKLAAEPAMSSNVLNSRFEFVYVFSSAATRRIGSTEFRGTLENIVFINSRQGKEYSDIHKATFPSEFADHFIRNFSSESVLDPFTGTGTTIAVSELLGRAAFGMEKDPTYCAVTLERLSALGLTPRLTESKQ